MMDPRHYIAAMPNDVVRRMDRAFDDPVYSAIDEETTNDVINTILDVNSVGQEIATLLVHSL